MRTVGKSPKTIRNYHAIILAALHQAVRWGWVRRNVAELAKAPRVSAKRVEAPSVEVVRKVIDAAEERDPRQAPLLMLAALTGMRRGELCALRWNAVDLDQGVIEVTGSVVVVPGGLAVKSTKTGRSGDGCRSTRWAWRCCARTGQGSRTGPASAASRSSRMPSCSRPTSTPARRSGRTT